MPILPAAVPQVDPVGALGVVLVAVADQAPGMVPAQVDGLAFTDGNDSSVELIVDVFEEVLASSADPIGNALAAILVPGILCAVCIEINLNRSISTRARGAIASGTVSSADIGICCEDEHHYDEQDRNPHWVLIDLLLRKFVD